MATAPDAVSTAATPVCATAPRPNSISRTSVSGNGESRPRDSVAVLLERCRDYLLYLANQEVSPELQVKFPPSDLVQESLIKANQSFESFRGKSEAELLAWLRQILVHTYLDADRRFREAECRDLGREQPLGAASQLPANDPSPSQQLAADELAGDIRAAVERLPVDYRQVILLRVWERRAFVEIGMEMNRSPEAVRKLWFRAVELLKKDWLESNASSTA